MEEETPKGKKREAINVSFKRSDTDLIKIFNLIPSENSARAAFARSLMRDGLKYRAEHGIPIVNGATETVDIDQLISPAISSIPPAPMAVVDSVNTPVVTPSTIVPIQPVSTVDKSPDELTDEEIDRMMKAAEL